MLTLLTTFAGIGLFLTGLHQIAHSMQALAGLRMQSVATRLSSGFFSSALGGLLLGLLTFTTSGATFVCMGLVKSNTISFSRAIPVLAWSGVGASIIVLFGAIDIKIGGLLMLCVVGFFDFSGATNFKSIKALMPILLAFGLMLLGLSMIKDGSRTFNENEHIKQIFQFCANQPFLIFMIGALITLIVQTSSVTAAIAIILNTSGLISFDEALLVIFGADFGYGLVLYYHALHLDNKNKRVALCSALVKFSGVLILYGIFLLQPTSFIWQFSETTSSHSVALNIYLVVLAIQATGALLISLMSHKVLKFLNWYYPDELSKTLYETKFIYPEAVAHPSTAIMLASQEVDRLIVGLIDNLNPLREDDGNHESIKQLDRHDACVSVSSKISSFIEQVALKNDSDEGIEKIFKLRAKNELVGLTQKSLNDFTLTLSPIIKSNIGLTTSLVEGLHLILMLLNESVLEEDSHDMLIELTSEKSQLMENIRKSLVVDNAKSVSEKQSLLIATGIFERVLWLVRQINGSIMEEKNLPPIKSN